jgi:hypothetical protein
VKAHCRRSVFMPAIFAVACLFGNMELRAEDTKKSIDVRPFHNSSSPLFDPKGALADRPADEKAEKDKSEKPPKKSHFDQPISEAVVRQA